MKKLISILLVCLLAISLAACQNTETAEQRVEPPIPGLHWCMTLEEAKQALGDIGELGSAGAGAEGQRTQEGFYLSPEQCEQLGVTVPGGMPEGSMTPVSAIFQLAEDGNWRLTTVMVTVNNTDEVEETLSQQYERPHEDSRIWTLGPIDEEEIMPLYRNPYVAIAFGQSPDSPLMSLQYSCGMKLLEQYFGSD